MSQYNYLGKCLVSVNGSFGRGRLKVFSLPWICRKCPTDFWLFLLFLVKLLESAFMEGLISDLKPTNPFFLFLTPFYSGVIVLWFYSLPSSS